MARNEEKAQSMLYRFREAQAAELGLGTRGDRRPKMASACKSLRECERWRGELLREISRKVSKIQDAGLTDYELRDLNDEINKLLREKRHWENQIVALGGANYRRNMAMLDDDGKEVPGTKGYKYFGRAKELPGVKELFQSRKKDEEEENQALAYYRKFTNQGPAYFGDLDENDGSLLDYERAAEDQDWADAHTHALEMLNLPSDTPVPPIPRGGPPPSSAAAEPAEPAEPTPAKATKTKGKAKAKPSKKSKRKAAESADADDTEMAAPDGDAAKRPKSDVAVASTTKEVDPADATAAALAAAVAYIPFLSPGDLTHPHMPTREEHEQTLLALRKKALVEEYFG
ncbi:Isy1-domain-containing protein [Coniophora puteana RWD-64-598 SS2]|uniref:Isy1-domain-containing protein n=1 Tax=Coniophora puteana (strain RWD-64-598) TaxID=741705 RepID=A0A5M3MGT7_CONPW|nr:Isy1-domain-containing protein [Coniophora puteana RWD-64-598 SS2]EIW78160.1 Isy1-domain-containing protein [Coniophora puteana RWD-64-598 SS2]